MSASDHDRSWNRERDGHSAVTLVTLATITLVVAVLYIGKALFLPLALGMLITFILTPAVTFLRRQGLRDTPAVILTVLTAAALVGAFLLIVGYQFSQIGANLAQYQGNVLAKIDGLLEAGKDSGFVSHLQGMIDNISARVEGAGAAPDASAMKVEVVEDTSPMDWLTLVIIPALSPVAIFGLIFVVVIFALMERDALRDRLVQLIGPSNILSTSRLLADAGARVSSYLVAQLVVNVIYAVPIWLGLWLIGIPNALFFGLVTLVLRFVPYIGSAISATLPLLMAFAVSPDWSLVLWTAALFGIVELVTSNVIEPWFYGQRTGVSPLAVIISSMFWTWLWGPMGLIIATPLTVCLVVIGQHVPGLRLFSILLGDKPTLAEPEQLYDRLLTGHSFAFTEKATLSTTERYLADYYDKTAIPALVLAQTDHEAGMLTDLQAQRIAAAAHQLTEELEPVLEEELAQEPPAEGDAAASIVTNGVPDGIGHRIVVTGARTRFDDAAAQMLAQALRAEGAEATVAVHRGEADLATSFEAGQVIFASLGAPDERVLGLRIRRLRRRLPDLQIGIALWQHATLGGDVPDAQLRKAGASFTVSGMEALMTRAFRPERETWDRSGSAAIPIAVATKAT